ncbi:hypothetical protein GT204_30705 [Streptomyces sp. SID4919]|uniref:YciI family protein n=1 Tax=unclassified Streptomyces TaxID=2593676 RepID=UPI000823BF7A|nr:MULTISPECIES: YciI family protein [unclassified Streptomyces]MYY13136.1 hypothetical protein [Streptomyces sp. SID4919]SCK37924.1 Uncharacterized conserved protein [Streptomyces sp. AmelKG-E11A]
MKYMVMILGTQADYAAMRGDSSDGSPAYTEQDLVAMGAFMSALSDDLAESGELIDGQGLTEPALARFVTGAPDDPRPVVTDGPYGETKEVLAGYWIVDCASLDRVTEIAARVTRCPQPAGSAIRPVVIRPLMAQGEITA